jgi:chemotaxis protein MotA
MATPATPLSTAPRPRAVAPKRKLLRPDAATLGGLILAFGGILGGLILEGGKLKDISQVTAALIVLGGTCGAVMVSTPMNVLTAAARRLAQVILDQSESPEAVIDELIGYATVARRNGLVALETDAMEIENPFLQKALMLAVDGTDLQEIRTMMQLEIELAERQAFAEARVFECAGGWD